MKIKQLKPARVSVPKEFKYFARLLDSAKSSEFPASKYLALRSRLAKRPKSRYPTLEAAYKPSPFIRSLPQLQTVLAENSPKMSRSKSVATANDVVTLPKASFTVPELSVLRKELSLVNSLNFQAVNNISVAKELEDSVKGNAMLDVMSDTAYVDKFKVLAAKIRDFLGSLSLSNHSQIYYKLIESNKSHEYEIRQNSSGNKLILTTEKLCVHGETLYNDFVCQFLLILQTKSLKKYNFANPEYNLRKEQTSINGFDFDFNRSNRESDDFVNNLMRIHSSNVDIFKRFWDSRAIELAFLANSPIKGLNRLRPKVNVGFVDYAKTKSLFQKHPSSPRIVKNNAYLFKSHRFKDYQEYKRLVKKHRGKVENLVYSNFTFSLLSLIYWRYGREKAYEFFENKILKGNNGVLDLSTSKFN